MKSKSYQQILLDVNMGEFYKAFNLKPHLLNAEALVGMGTKIKKLFLAKEIILVNQMIPKSPSCRRMWAEEVYCQGQHS